MGLSRLTDGPPTYCQYNDNDSWGNWPWTMGPRATQFSEKPKRLAFQSWIGRCQGLSWRRSLGVELWSRRLAGTQKLKLFGVLKVWRDEKHWTTTQIVIEHDWINIYRLKLTKHMQLQTHVTCFSAPWIFATGLTSWKVPRVLFWSHHGLWISKTSILEVGSLGFELWGG